MRIVFTLFQSIHTLCLSLWPRLKKDGFSPQYASVGALLHRLGHVSHGNVLLSTSDLDPHSLQPQLRTLGVLQTCLLQDRPSLGQLPWLLLKARKKQPQWNGVGVLLELILKFFCSYMWILNISTIFGKTYSFVVQLSGSCSIASLLLNLPPHHPQLMRSTTIINYKSLTRRISTDLRELGMLLQSFIQQRHSFIDVLEHPLQLGWLHHDPSSPRAGTCLLQQPPRSLVLSILTLELHGSQPDLLTVGIGLKGKGQNGTSCRYISLSYEICVHRHIWHHFNLWA